MQILQEQAKKETIKYWDKEENKKLVYKVDCSNALIEETNIKGKIIYKQNKELIKEITSGRVNRNYIANPYSKNKKIQLSVVK